jgi:hypothetical protein
VLKCIGRMELRRLPLFGRMITHGDDRLAIMKMKYWVCIEESFQGVRW